LPACRLERFDVSTMQFKFPLNEIIFHVALSYLRMYACGPGTLWGEHPSEQVESYGEPLRLDSYGAWIRKKLVARSQRPIVLSEPSKIVSYH
jgi:hypothetical protein